MHLLKECKEAKVVLFQKSVQKVSKIVLLKFSFKNAYLIFIQFAIVKIFGVYFYVP